MDLPTALDYVTSFSLSASEKFFLLYLISYGGKIDRISAREFAPAIGISPRTVQRVVHNLKARGHIEIISSKDGGFAGLGIGPNSYTLGKQHLKFMESQTVTK